MREADVVYLVEAFDFLQGEHPATLTRAELDAPLPFFELASAVAADTAQRRMRRHVDQAARWRKRDADERAERRHRAELAKQRAEAARLDEYLRPHIKPWLTWLRMHEAHAAELAARARRRAWRDWHHVRDTAASRLAELGNGPPELVALAVQVCEVTAYADVHPFREGRPRCKLCTQRRNRLRALARRHSNGG